MLRPFDAGDQEHGNPVAEIDQCRSNHGFEFASRRPLRHRLRQAGPRSKRFAPPVLNPFRRFDLRPKQAPDPCGVRCIDSGVFGGPENAQNCGVHDDFFALCIFRGDAEHVFRVGHRSHQREALVEA